MKKNLIFSIFRAVYTIVWALLMMCIGTLTLVNHKYLIGDVGFGTLIGIAVISTYVMIMLWNVNLIPPGNVPVSNESSK